MSRIIMEGNRQFNEQSSDSQAKLSKACSNHRKNQKVMVYCFQILKFGFFSLFLKMDCHLYYCFRELCILHLLIKELCIFTSAIISSDAHTVSRSGSCCTVSIGCPVTYKEGLLILNRRNLQRHKNMCFSLLDFQCDNYAKHHFVGIYIKLQYGILNFTVEYLGSHIPEQQQH